MHLDSKQIKDNFSKFSNIYDENTNIQQKSAYNLVTESLNHLNLTPNSNILDLGSGTGNIAKFITQQRGQDSDSKNNIVNCDFSLSMLESPSTKAHRVCADMCHLPFKNQEFFTHIYSSFCFQWLNNQQIKTLLQYLHQICKPGALLSFCHPIDGSFHEFHDSNTISDCNFRFAQLPAIENINKVIEGSGFSLKYSTIDSPKIKYKNTISFLRSIKNSGAGYNFYDTNNYVTRKKVKKISDILFKKYDNFVTWKVLNCYLVKN